MSKINRIETIGDKFSLIINTTRAFTIRHPEWWTWLLSLYIWGWLIGSSFMFSSEDIHSGRLIYCMTSTDQFGSSLELNGVVKELDLSSKVGLAFKNGLLPWAIMIIAMMFPLLNEAIRHMAFSVRKSDRDLGILSFLSGYALIWIVAGVLFLLIPLAIDQLFGARSLFRDTLLATLVFLLTAIVIWFPSRATVMARCAQTMPIRINGGYLYLDGIKYGAWMGIACIRMCWLPMTALMLAHHSVYLMLVVTIIVIVERYLVPHTSKLPSYGFGIIALLTFSYGLYQYL